MSMPKEFRQLIPLDKAKAIVLSHPPTVDEELVSLESANGRVLAEKVVSQIDVPGFLRASMDGYAVKAADTIEAREDRPVRLSLAGRVTVGCLPDVEVGSGQAAEISTGAMMPPGADAVVMIEHCEGDERDVSVRRPVHPGQNVLSAGSDIMFGDMVLLPGTILSARQIGLLAALGRDRVRVRLLKVGIASTGNELAQPGTALLPGKIFDINSYSIAAAAEECGATPVRYGILPDDHDEMVEALQKISRECSMTLVSGSTSAGVGDMVYRILDVLGKTIFHGVNLKPGKPTLFGTISEKPVLGLPGNPTSALTVFGLLAAPSIRKALGIKVQGQTIKGKLAHPVRSEGMHQLLPVSIYKDRVYSVDKGSSSITTLAQADGVIEIPSQMEYLGAGQVVKVHLFGELKEPDLVITGENCPFLEQLAETLPLQIKLMTSGNRQGIAALDDGLADIACVSNVEEKDISESLSLIRGYTRVLGFMSRDPDILKMKGPNPVSLIGWPRYSEMNWIFQAAFKDLGIELESVLFAGTVRTHHAVASAVASGRAKLGFGAMLAAEKAGLCFRKMAEDRIDFIVAKSGLEDEGVKAFVSALRSCNLRVNLSTDNITGGKLAGVC